jgi:hypothetical protein
VTSLDLRHAPEFVFELLVCRWAERAWPGDDDAIPVVGRQVGTRDRRWDTVVVEADPEGLAARARFGAEEIDCELLRVVSNAPAEWAWYRDAIPDPGFPWRYVREAIDRATARGVVKRRKRNNRVEIRRIAPYPDWVRRVVAIENKPDLDRSAARRLGEQLDHDVERALADETWLATAATGDRVEPALLRDIPDEAGILAVSRDDDGRSVADVSWHPARLNPDPSDRKRRLVVAERVYGRGFRDHVETMRPDCRHYELRRRGTALIPYCAAKERHQTQTECAASCESFEPEPPAWRTRGWPIEGGPGAACRAVLERRRARARGREE